MPGTAWEIPDVPAPPKTTPPDADPGIEVATVKPSRPDEGLSLMTNRSGMVNSSGTTLADLVKFAYGVHPRQIIGAPAWAESERFDVAIKPDTPGMPNINQMGHCCANCWLTVSPLPFTAKRKSFPHT